MEAVILLFQNVPVDREIILMLLIVGFFQLDLLGGILGLIIDRLSAVEQLLKDRFIGRSRIQRVLIVIRLRFSVFINAVIEVVAGVRIDHRVDNVSGSLVAVFIDRVLIDPGVAVRIEILSIGRAEDRRADRRGILALVLPTCGGVIGH